AERPAQERAILGVTGDRAPVHHAGGGDDAVARHRPLAEPGRERQRSQHLDAARIAQRLQARQRRQAPHRGLQGGRAHWAAPRRTSTTLWPPNANELETAAGGWPFEPSRGRASPGTESR